MADTPLFVILPTRWTVPGNGSIVDGEFAVNPIHVTGVNPDRTIGEGCALHLVNGRVQPCTLPMREVIEALTFDGNSFDATQPWRAPEPPRMDTAPIEEAPLAAVGPHVVEVTGDEWTVEHPECAGRVGVCTVVATFAKYFSGHTTDGSYDAVITGHELRLTPIGVRA